MRVKCFATAFVLLSASHCCSSWKKFHSEWEKSSERHWHFPIVQWDELKGGPSVEAMTASSVHSLCKANVSAPKASCKTNVFGQTVASGTLYLPTVIRPGSWQQIAKLSLWPSSRQNSWTSWYYFLWFLLFLRVLYKPTDLRFLVTNILLGNSLSPSIRIRPSALRLSIFMQILKRYGSVSLLHSKIAVKLRVGDSVVA